MQTYIIDLHGQSSGYYRRVPDNVVLEFVARPCRALPAEMTEAVIDNLVYKRLQDSGHPVQRCQPGDIYPDLILDTEPPDYNDPVLQGMYKLEAVQDMQREMFRWRSSVNSVRAPAIFAFRWKHNLLPAIFENMGRVNLSDLVYMFGPGTYRILSCRSVPVDAGFPEKNMFAINTLDPTGYPKMPQQFGNRLRVPAPTLWEALVASNQSLRNRGVRWQPQMMNDQRFSGSNRQLLAKFSKQHVRTRLQSRVAREGVYVHEVGDPPDRFVPGVDYVKGRVAKKRKRRPS